MPRHYIRVLDSIEPHARSIAAEAEDWARHLFNDITENGKCLTVVHLLANSRGPRLGVCGETFFCEIGLDALRDDCFFLYRVDSADERLPREVPSKIVASFVLHPGGPKELTAYDSVRSYFGASAAGASSLPKGDPGLREPTAVQQAKPSPALAKALGSRPASLRARWRPNASHRVDLPDGVFGKVSEIWSRRRLDRFAEPSARMQVILKGHVTPNDPAGADAQSLLNLFGIHLFNNIVALADSTELEACLDELASFSLPATIRAAVWAQMVAGLDRIELRRELFQTASALYAISGTEAGEATTAELFPALEITAGALGDVALQEALEFAKAATAPLRHLSAWASQLAFDAVPREEGRSELAVDTSDLEIGSSNRPHHGESQPILRGAAMDSVASGVDEWVCRLRNLGSTRRAALAVEVAELVSPFAKQAENLSHAAGLREFVRELEVFREGVESLAADLPSEAAFERELADAQVAYGALTQALGTPIPPEFLSTNPSPAELRGLADLLAESERPLRALPNWVWSPEFELSERTELQNIAKELLDPQVRERARAFVTACSEFEISQFESLARVPEPPDGQDLTDHVRDFLQLANEEIRLLEAFPSPYHGYRNRLFESGLSPQSVLAALNELESLDGRVPAETFQALCELLQSVEEPDLDSLVRQYGVAVEFFERAIGSDHGATLAQLSARVSQQPRKQLSDLGYVGKNVSLEVEHLLVGDRTSRPTLSFVPDGKAPYGSIDLPIVLRTNRPEDIHVVVDPRLKGDWRSAWPHDWPAVQKVEQRITRNQWRSGGAKEDFFFTIVVSVPVRPPKDSRESLECRLFILDGDTEGILCERTLRWEQVAKTPRSLVVDWPDGLDKAYVEKHPVGPQKNKAAIERRVESGSSLAITAPRRFGKSTLIQYLARSFRDRNWYVADPVVCTSFNVGNAVDHAALWQAVSRSLQEHSGAGLDPDLVEGLPSSSAFSHVLDAAERNEKGGVLVLIDEAQLLFPRASGYALGDRFKDRIERAWSKAASGRLPVVFVFVGLPSFVERAGTNLIGLLRPIQGVEMEDADLNRLLLQVTSEVLETSSAARKALIRAAPNLYLMRGLVEHLCWLLQRHGRCWADVNDVEHIQFELVEKLKEGQEAALAKVIRDALNDADDVNSWMPRREYPVALALARARGEGHRAESELVAITLEHLESWCAEISGEGGFGSLSVSQDVLREHLRTLSESGILEGATFVSSLMEALLIGDCRSRYPEDARDALIKCAYQLIRIPEGAQPVGEGGEAKIYRFSRDDIEYALRIVNLEDGEQKQRFLEGADAIHRLAQSEYRSAAGAQYLFDVRQVGFLQGNEMAAAQVYRWVDGFDLSDKEGSLSQEMVVEIGYKLAQGLDLIHRHNVLHRDIRPANIILSQKEKDPVLIDFGMAQFEANDMNTVVGTKFAAPEVRAAQPAWSRAADVYSLGATLHALLHQASRRSDSLDALLKKMHSESAPERPTAEFLVNRFREIRGEVEVQAKYERFWRRIQNAAEQDCEKTWFRIVLSSFQSKANAVALGIQVNHFDVLSDIADLLNQFLEAYPISGRHEGSITHLSLGVVKRDNSWTGSDLVTQEVDLLWALRTWAAHGESKKKKQRRILSVSGNAEPNAMREMVRAGAKQIGVRLDCPTLPAVIDVLLEGWVGA